MADRITQAELEKAWRLVDQSAVAKKAAEEATQAIAARLINGASVEPGDHVFTPARNTVCLCVEGIVFEAPGSGAAPPRVERGFTTQRRVLIWAWIAIVMLAILFPPWESRAGYEVGVNFILDPPPLIPVAHIDAARLLLELIVVSLPVGGLWFVHIAPSRDR
jgi:hypothetical protein